MGILVAALTTVLGSLAAGCGNEAAPESADAGSRSYRLSELLADDDLTGYDLALEPRDFRFPGDHGAHPGFRNEWWYFTGNLDGDGESRFGYQLTIFRFAVAPDVPPSGSAWRTNQVMIGHFAVTDVSRQKFHVAQKYARAAVGQAGFAANPVAVWIDDWRIEHRGSGGWELAAGDGATRLALTLVPMTEPTPNGDGGLSQKSAQPGNASYYYSVSRLDSQGELAVGGRAYQVSGLSWLDREWGSSSLAPDQAGWDWFALQLSDGNDLMLYRLRYQDGSTHPYSGGTWIASGRAAETVAVGEATIRSTGVWTSAGGTRYPSGWHIEVPAHGISLDVRPVLAGQELVTMISYWEGAVDVTGRSGGQPVTGRGYAELTGYDAFPTVGGESSR